jgi:acyl-CoA reductase-like NAD-dependent aldehyde dehydrogenase
MSQDYEEVTPFVAGSRTASASRSRLDIVNPSTGQRLGDIPEGASGDIDAAADAARSAFPGWRDLSPSRRKGVLSAWADLVLAHAGALDRLDALEMGKPVGLPMFGAAMASGLVRFNAEAVDKWQGDVLVTDRGSTVIQKRVPRGVVGAIVPWNFPTYNALLKTAPALAAGNTVVLKPSELASQSALLLAELAIQAGIPAGVLNVVPGRGEVVGKALACHADVDMISFTGSTEVGRLVAGYGAGSNLKVVSAECGGKSPHIVFADNDDLGGIATAIAHGLLLNQGQVCSMGSRLLVEERIADELVDRIATIVRGTTPGDALDPAVSFGPLASREQFDRVVDHIETGRASGATLVEGGHRYADRNGYFVPPTIFLDVPQDSRLAQEEIFGPVLSVIRFADADEAVRIAEGTCYGLAAYVWTQRLDNGFRLADRLQTGVTFVNAGLPSGEGPGYGFSGEPARLSGTGVEGGLAGLDSYLRRQTIWLNHG